MHHQIQHGQQSVSRLFLGKCEALGELDEDRQRWGFHQRRMLHGPSHQWQKAREVRQQGQQQHLRWKPKPIWTWHRKTFLYRFFWKLFHVFFSFRIWVDLRWRVTRIVEANRRCSKDFWHGQRRWTSTRTSSLTSLNSPTGSSRPSTRNTWTQSELWQQHRKLRHQQAK